MPAEFLSTREKSLEIPRKTIAFHFYYFQGITDSGGCNLDKRIECSLTKLKKILN